MRNIFSLLVILIFSLTTYSQQNTVLNLSSSISNNTYKSPSNNFYTTNFLYRTSPLVQSLEENPYSNYSVNDTRFNNQKNWMNNRKELRFSVGVTQFLGDLGGKDQIGKDYSLRDLNMKSTNLMAMIGYRHRLNKLFATTTSITIGMLKGADSLIEVSDQKNPDGRFQPAYYRKARNLSFRAPILEVSQRVDFLLYRKEKIGKRYNIRGLKGFNNRNEQIYVFAGVGIVAFAPQANYNGQWYNLRKLSTEGQGLVDGIRKTLPVTVCTPVGIGFRVGISREWRIGMEASYTKTFSDYIDDVAGEYYDNKLLYDQKGSVAAALADRSDKTNPEQHNWFGTGQKRGDKQKDAYFFINVVLTRNITYRSYTQTHKRYKLSKGKYKF